MKKKIVSTAIFFSCFAGILYAQKHNSIQTVIPPGAGMQLAVHNASVSEPYPFHFTSNGEIRHSTSLNGFFSATVKHHRLHGKWESHYANGRLLDEGKLVKGLPDGEWKLWDANGNLLAVRNYNTDLLLRIQQEIRLNHPRNDVYSITALYKKQGSAALRYLKPTYSFALPKPAKFPSPAALVESNAQPNANYHPPFNECLHHGAYMNYYSNGQVKDSGYYKEGLKNGVWLHRTAANGSYWKGAYKHGHHVSEWKLYNVSGKLILLVFYNHSGEELWRKEM